MPAPQASAMKQLARAKFMSFGLTVPTNWQNPTGDPDAAHFRDAFKPSEKTSTPATPPLFKPATLNKYHTDIQKMHVDKIGKFIDGITSAICSAWGQWQSATVLTGVMINAVTAAGGQLVGPPLMPLIMASAPKATPMELKYSTVIATVISNGWLTFTATVKVPGLPWYPAFAAFPGPMAPPMPNTPAPFAALVQMPASIAAPLLKTQMVGQLADPAAPFHAQLFESIADAFEKSYNAWKGTTMVTNVLGTGAIPTFAPPFVPAGPVVGGVGNMTPGGLT